jgi:hypothetical protein
MIAQPNLSLNVPNSELTLLFQLLMLSSNTCVNQKLFVPDTEEKPTR